MSLANFVSDYTGALEDQTRQLLVANTSGTDTTWPVTDLWMKFFQDLEGAGVTIGGETLDEKTRDFLLVYTGLGDVGQTINDLWNSVTGPYVPL